MPLTRYSLRELLRIAHLEACRELSDRARSQVSTYGDTYRRGGELVEEARQLVSLAEDVLRLAVTAERGASTSWESIGEALEITRQSAHQRFNPAVEEIIDGVLYPFREGEAGQLQWWACPDGLQDPDDTVRRLDAWALRHQERWDPGKGEHRVSENLTGRVSPGDGIDVVLRLARQLVARELPVGVSDKLARRVLIEHKIHAFEQIANTRDRILEDLEFARRALDWAEWDMTHAGYWTASDGTYRKDDRAPYGPDLQDALAKFNGDEAQLVLNYRRCHAAVEDLETKLAFGGDQKIAKDAADQVHAATQELIAWHREDLDERLSVVPVTNDGARGSEETYRFILDDRPVAELGFTVSPDPATTGWFTCDIDPDAFARSPDTSSAWLGDHLVAIDVTGVAPQALAQLWIDAGQDVVRAAAVGVIEVTRSTAVIQGRRQVIANLADERARALST